MVEVKWSTCSPSFPTIRIRIPVKSAVLSSKILVETNENVIKQELAFSGNGLVVIMFTSLTSTPTNPVQIPTYWIYVRAVDVSQKNQNVSIEYCDLHLGKDFKQ